MTTKLSENSKKKSKWPIYFSLVILSVLVLAYFFVPAVEIFIDEAWNVLSSGDQAKMENWVAQFAGWGPLILILAMIAQMFLIIVPSIMLMVVTILTYGPIWGSLIVFFAVFSASTVGYGVGKYLGENRVKKIIGHKSEEKVAAFLKDYGFWAVIITRLNPFLSNDAISFVGGILKMGYWKFTGATLLGITPLIIFIAFLGKSTANLKLGLFWGSIISLILFIGYIWWDKKRKNNSDK